MTRPHRDPVSDLIKAATAIRDAFNYNPGHSDLYNEQPIHISVTLGEWRRLNLALITLEHERKK